MSAGNSGDRASKRPSRRSIFPINLRNPARRRQSDRRWRRTRLACRRYQGVQRQPPSLCASLRQAVRKRHFLGRDRHQLPAGDARHCRWESVPTRPPCGGSTARRSSTCTKPPVGRRRRRVETTDASRTDVLRSAVINSTGTTSCAQFPTRRKPLREFTISLRSMPASD